MEDNPNDVGLTLRALKKHNQTNKVRMVKPMDFDKFVEAVVAVGLYWVLLNQAPV